MNDKVVFSVVLSASLCIAQSFYSTQQIEPSSTACPPGGKAIVSLDLIDHPRSLDRLLYQSELIVRGTVTQALLPFHPDPNSLLNIESDFKISVTNTLLGSLPGSSSIDVFQEGGKTAACEEIVPEDQPMKVGEEYVLFLRKAIGPVQSPSGSPDRYMPIGVWQGKARINGKVIRFLPSVNQGLHQYDGKDVLEFLTLIEARIVALRLVSACRQCAISRPTYSGQA